MPHILQLLSSQVLTGVVYSLVERMDVALMWMEEVTTAPALLDMKQNSTRIMFLCLVKV